MTVKDLQELLPQNIGVTSKLKYDYDRKNKTLTIIIPKSGLTANMQDDGGAFETWAILFKFYLKEYVDFVKIDWECNLCKGDKGILHYNRFVYRLSKFIQTYEWAKSSKPIPAIPTILYANFPTQQAADITEYKKGSEGSLECNYVDEHKKEYDCINHQFPVGIFYDKVSSHNHYTTGGKSDIDIWAVKNNELFIFELKKTQNKPVGIISEIMFYTNFMYDVLSHRIKYEFNDKTMKSVKNNYRDFGHFYDVYKKGSIRKINAILLTDSLHPAITDDMLSFINESPRLKMLNIKFLYKSVIKESLLF